MNISRIAIAFFILLTLTIQGCYSPTTYAPEEGDLLPTYSKILKKWSRGDKLFKRLEARLHISATLKSVEFRRAYIAEYAHRYRLDGDKTDVLLNNELDAHKAYNEFFISTYTPSDDWNDFAEENSIWQLYLIDGEGRRAEPTEIEELDRGDVLLNEFFPYIDPWSKVYIVRFPRYDTTATIPIGDNESATLKLMIVGIKATGTLVWEIEDLGGETSTDR